MKSQVQDRFHDFHHTWLSKLEEILHHLIHRTQLVVLTHPNDVVNLQHLVNTTTSHIKHYYTVKWAEAREDVLPSSLPRGTLLSRMPALGSPDGSRPWCSACCGVSIRRRLV
ncbi:hypothetical protein K1719_045668 [Acacia pycnantha]|nr:hypothetical protein K1719_045668 [Acacia pycnantha]